MCFFYPVDLVYGRALPVHWNGQKPHTLLPLFLLQDIVTHQLKFSEIVKGIELVNNSTQSIKVILLPDI